jgi:acetyltransferase-like isoleucine patch superfamily enzyme
MTSNKPLIFLGSNVAISQFAETAQDLNIEVAGIIDGDYYGNTESIDGIPIIDSEQSFNDAEKLEYYRQNYVFFCATNWIPQDDAVSKRNKEKRHRLIDLIDQSDLPCMNIIDPRAKIHSSTKLGKGIYIDSFALVDPNVTIGDYTTVYAFSGLGHGSTFGRNCVIQRHISITGDVTFGDNVFLGTACKILKTGVTISSGTFVHEAIYLKRGTIENEIISRNGVNTKRVLHREELEVA